VLGYVRVSTAEQASHSSGPDAQEAAIRKAVAAYGWDLLELISDNGTSGSVAPDRRDGLGRALAMLDSGEADVLIAAKVDRVSRSVLDFMNLSDRADRGGWRLLTLDVLVDTTTPIGKMMRTMLAAFAELERDFIAQRTREALAVKRAQGVVLGRPVQLPPEVGQRIIELRAEGLTWQQIADQLTADSVPTARGGVWTWNSARSVHARLARSV
jgi:DNA invertase Pin-like site-specific DNA recombinase